MTTEQLAAQHKARVASGDKRRYFCEDGELIHCDSRTYAITNGWGKQAFQAIQNILVKFQDKGVKCEKQPKDMAKLRIIWQEWDDVPSDGFGHGVEFHDTTIDNREESLVGFLDGFDWCHGSSNEVVIHCIKPNTRTPLTVLSSMKQRLEEILSDREIPTQQITSRIRAWVNS